MDKPKTFKTYTGMHVTNPALLPPDKPSPRKTGRPSAYTPELAERVLDHVANGGFIVDIGGDGLPNWRSIYRWADARSEFRQALARAHADGAHALLVKAEKLLENATRDDIQVVRERVAHIRWRVSRLNPAAYGDRSELRVSGTVEHVHRISDDAPAWIKERIEAPRPPTSGIKDITPKAPDPETQH